MKPVKTLMAFCAWMVMAFTVSAQPSYFNNASGSSSLDEPFNSSTDQRVQWLYLPGDFPTAHSSNITDIYFRTNTGTGSYTLADVSVSLGQISGNSLGTSWNSGLTSVYTATSASLTVLTGGWIKVTLPTPYAYDNTKSLIVEASCSSTSGFSLAHATGTPTGRLYGSLVTTSPTADGALADFGFDLACPNITQQPKDTTICQGTNTIFVVKATNATSYQWEVNTGSGYSSITDNSTYSGSTTDTLKITAATGAMNSYTYRCKITRGTCDVNSNGKVLTIKVPVTITTQPSPTSLALCPGDNTTITVAATGTNLQYNWRVNDNSGSNFQNIGNNSTYSGANTATLTITGATPSMNGYLYRCLINGECASSASSDVVTITMNTPPNVTTDPVNKAICPGANTSFSAAATGTGVTYRWQVNDGSSWANVTNSGVYSGATTTTLNITAAPYSMNGYQYRCVVTGTCNPKDTTAPATLTVHAVPAVTGGPANTVVCPGANTSLSASGSGTGIAYQWQVIFPSSGGWINVVDGGVYTGATTPTLNFTAVPASFDGYVYRCIISGTCSPSVTTGYALLTVNATLPITAQPSKSTVTCNGVSTSMSVNSNAANVTYQWQVNDGTGFVNTTDGAAYSGSATKMLNILTPGLSADGYKYRCILNNGCAANTSDTSVLTVQAAPVVTADPVNSHVCQHTPTSFSVTATGAGLTYQWQVNDGSSWANVPVSTAYSGNNSATLNVQNPQPSQNGYVYRCVVKGNCLPSDTSLTATLTVDGKPQITTNPSNFTTCSGGDASFTVVATGTGLTYQWQENNGSGYTNIANGGRYSGATSATLNISAPPVTMDLYSYRCVVSGTCAPPTTSQMATLYIHMPPTVITQPTNKIACETFSTTFDVGAVASSSTPFSYQWFVDDGTGFVALANDATYAGVTTKLLTVSNITGAMDGYRYRCDISTPCTPGTSSNVVTLTVNLLPKISMHPNNATICPTANTIFDVTASGTSLNYQWQVNDGSGWVNIPGTPTYSGSNSAVLSVVNATKSMNNYQYRCIVGGSCPSTTSNVATLTVLNTVDILSHTLTDTACEGSTTKLKATVAGVGLYYQWQIKDASGNYADILNIPPYSGANTDILTIANIPATLDGAIYRCKAYETSVCNLPYYTADIPLVVNAAPPTTPSQLTTAYFSTATFTVDPSGTSYQWQENRNDGVGFRNLVENANYAGVHTNVLTVQPVYFEMTNYQYRCVIAGICDAATTSKPATLIVDPALSVSNVAKNGQLIMNIFPNPLSGSQLNVRFDKALKGATEVRVMDKMGKLVYNGTLNINGQNTAVVELNHLAAGSYMLQVVNTTEGVNQTVQFTKQ